MMALDLHSAESSHFLPDKLDDDALSTPHINNQPSPLSPRAFRSHLSSFLHDDEDDDFITHFTRQMHHSMSQYPHEFDSQDIASSNSDELKSWDFTVSSQSSLWSPLASNQGSPEGPSLEPTPPPTPGDAKHSCSDDVVGMLDNMNLDEAAGIHAYPNQSFNHSNQSLIHQQIRAVQLSRLKQEQQNNIAYRDSEQIQPAPKKGKACGVGSGNNNGQRMNRSQPVFSWNSSSRTAPPQAGSGMRAVFLGGSGSSSGSCGTGVFLPRGTSTGPSESRKKQGCSTVLIPARVVQALQHHFDQMAATSGSKAGGFPPLHDVLVSNKDGMYSLQKRQSRKEPAKKNDMVMLPQEWTY